MPRGLGDVHNVIIRLGFPAGLLFSLAGIVGCAPHPKTDTRPGETAGADFLRAREAVERCIQADFRTTRFPTVVADEIRNLGGPEAAIAKLGLYLRARGELVQDRDIVPVILGHCGAEAVPV